ncbi:MAG: tRNA (adenosine(37)-N6)-threonylcarbamoyltransferase complex ATPase subunit type 1 TsaE [FCB group bacterium]|jgi:tRNA threonylcarbamoyladenosine biosynthesis protein TsaE|nr:tRNA (adenosine(37)-N6)-threonylcarbamoyltransferase complex ATPase subunit type 1 TsaE [FCB group bacterium]
MELSLILETRSPEETERLGTVLASIVPPGSVVALRGDLAAGKTCLVRGMAAYYAKGVPIHSPTFTLVNEYGDSPRLFHVDLYRLDPEEVLDLGYEEIFEPEGVTVVEWAERAERLLPSQRLDVLLEHAGGDRRHLSFRDHGVMSEGWTEQLASALR